MNEKTLRALIEAGAVKQVHIIADGSRFHVRVDTLNGSLTASKVRGGVKTWGSLEAVARWIRSLGIGRAMIDLVRWQPGQRGMKI